MTIQKPSPNFSSREGQKPIAIVVHVMAGTLSGTAGWFQSTASQVSSHYGVGNSGEVHQYVKEMDCAWANGRVLNPTWKLIKPGVNPNLYTLSIETEGNDLSKAPVALKTASGRLIRELADRWAIPLDRDHVIGHYEIFSGKPNCPATDKSVLDELIQVAKNIVTPPPATDLVAEFTKLEAQVATIKKLVIK